MSTTLAVVEFALLVEKGVETGNAYLNTSMIVTSSSNSILSLLKFLRVNHYSIDLS